MKDRRKNKTKRKVLLALYLAVCLVIIVAAYFHLSRIARNFNTEHLELITGLYAEKMNDSMEYLQNYVQEDIKMIRSMENAQPEEILEQLEKNLDKTVFGDMMAKFMAAAAALFPISKRRSWMRRRWLQILLLTRILTSPAELEI